MNLNLEQLFAEVKEFCKETHGSSDYDKDELFVMGQEKGEFAPMTYLVKKLKGFKGTKELLQEGFVFDSYDLFDCKDFQPWFEKQFSRKLTRSIAKKISLLHLPKNKVILDAIETVNKCYEILRNEYIIMNGKKLPVQLGEWYAKCIFGLQQTKSTSQRGFDFLIGNKRVEVKVHWSDYPSPKGVKLRKSLVELSDYTIVIYIARNFMIREVCFLDSDFVKRKFAGKGHVLFLKDSEVSPYFFSKSNKHYDKVVNSSALLRFSSPTLAMKLAEAFQ